MSAHEAAVQAMAGAICYGVCSEGDHEAGEEFCIEAAEIAMGALTTSPDVRAALVEALDADRRRGFAPYYAGNAVDAILAALTPEPQS